MLQNKYIFNISFFYMHNFSNMNRSELVTVKIISLVGFCQDGTFSSGRISKESEQGEF